MFVIRTGLQGNGKTLNTIKEVDTKAFAEGRTVYYCNITKFNPSHPAIKAQWIEFDTPEKWYELPQNSIIVIDEAQTWFRVRPQGSRVPEHASRLEIMRKDGHELHCITQSPKLLDSHMRELCNLHIHYNRGNGGSIIKRWEFQKPELTVNANKMEFQNGEYSRITIDKTYFGCYESVKEGSGHHFKFRPPKALFVLAACIALCGFLGYRVYTHRIAVQPHDVQSSAPGEPSSAPASIPVPGSVSPVTTQQFVDSRIPRVPDMPSSAPLYDDLTRPVAYPKTFCISSKSEDLLERNASRMTMGYREGRLYGCRCNTQQGTKVEISFDACMAYVENGAFDPAIPDRPRLAQQAPAAVGPVEERDGTSAAGARRRLVHSATEPVIVSDSEFGRRPWHKN